MKSPLLEFDSDAFPIVGGEDQQTNPGVYGQTLAAWIAQELPGHGVATGAALAEDFGWVVEIASQTHRVYVACSNEEDSRTRWRAFVFSEGGLLARLFGKDRRAEEVAIAFAALEKLLKSHPGIRNLEQTVD